MVEYLLEINVNTSIPFFAYESMSGERFAVSYNSKKEMLLVLYAIRKSIRERKPQTWEELKGICYEKCIENGISKTESKNK
jgi:hypothetical protein